MVVNLIFMDLPALHAYILNDAIDVCWKLYTIVTTISAGISQVNRETKQYLLTG
jgi:hypothetical protein